jgi:hypothetical protein
MPNAPTEPHHPPSLLHDADRLIETAEGCSHHRAWCSPAGQRAPRHAPLQQ